MWSWVGNSSVERKKTHLKLLSKCLKAFPGRVNLLVKTWLLISYWSEQEELTSPAVTSLASYLPKPHCPRLLFRSNKVVCGGSTWYECYDSLLRWLQIEENNCQEVPYPGWHLHGLCCFRRKTEFEVAAIVCVVFLLFLLGTPIKHLLSFL